MRHSLVGGPLSLARKREEAVEKLSRQTLIAINIAYDSYPGHRPRNVARH
jgi:hypothetical protein